MTIRIWMNFKECMVPRVCSSCVIYEPKPVFPGETQQVSWSPKPHLIKWYVHVLGLSCFYIQSRFPSEWTTGSPLWNLEYKIWRKDQELRLSKFIFMKARCFYAATEQCCRAAFGVERSWSCIASRNSATTWDQLHGSKSWNSFALLCCLMLSYAVSCGVWIHIWLCQPDPTSFYKSPFWRKTKESKPKKREEIRLWKKKQIRKVQKCRMQRKIQRTTCYVAFVFALFLYFCRRVFALFQKKKRTQKYLFFLFFLVVSILNLLFVFAFSNCMFLHALGDVVCMCFFRSLFCWFQIAFGIAWS